MEDLVRDLSQAIASRSDKPFAFFGHSMGSLVAFETARNLSRDHGSEPVHLFVSARPAPQLETDDVSPRQLSDDDLIARVQERSTGVPDALVDQPELLRLMVPALRADLEILDSYRYQPGTPLRCPLSALDGAADPIAAGEQLAAWALQTSAAFEQRTFPGDHFFINTAREEVVAWVARELGVAGVAVQPPTRSPALAWDGAAGISDPRDAEDIQDWIVGRIASLTGVDDEEIDIARPFSEFGLDSSEALLISDELGRWLDTEIAPTIAWYYPTIEELSRYLCDLPAS